MKKTKEISFLDAYKPPYYIDKGDNQVCAQDNPHHGMVMAWDWVDNTITGKRYLLNDIKKNIVRKVNGENVELPIKFTKDILQYMSIQAKLLYYVLEAGVC